LTFAAKSKGKDVLYVFNAQNGSLQKKWEFDLDGVYSPTYSPDGRQIAFSALKDGCSDVCLLDVKSGAVKKITDDIYEDKYPSFSPEGSIAFVSDRPDSAEEYDYGNYAVFVSDDGLISRVTPRTAYVASPFFDPDGGLFFVADYDSAYNLYWISNDSLRMVKRTDVLTGIYYPTISRNGGKIAFSSLNNYGYDVCVVEHPLTKMLECKTPEDMIGQFAYDKTDLDNKMVKKYTPKFTVDYFTAGASYYSSLGISGLCEIGLSDVLGNHHIEMAFDLYGDLLNSDVRLNYWYLEERTDFGFGLFQHLDYFGENYDLFVWRYLGCGGIIQYPFDRFFRAELGLYAFKIYESRWLDYFPWYYSTTCIENDYDFYYPSLALVWDNAKWSQTGPCDGYRVRVEGYATIWSDFEIRSCVSDYRRYFRLSPRASFAMRFVGVTSFGPDVEHWSIGGSNSLRGFDDYAFSGSKLGLANFEYRFPFVDRLNVAFPLPLDFRNIRGVFFTDVGGVYTDSFVICNTNGGFHLQDLKMGVGAGMRTEFLSMIWQLDVARAHNLQCFTDDWKFHFTIGAEW
jgi:hypothetical protein